MPHEPIHGPTASGKHYIIRAKHRDGTPGAAQWLRTISGEHEFRMFERADREAWVDSAGNYWSVLEGGQVIGTQEERIAKHPRTSNARDPWHGYPASPSRKGDGDTPGDEVIDGWYSNELVTKSLARRIKRRQV